MRLSRGARRLFDLIRWYACRFPEVFPLRSTLARRLKCSCPTVGRWLAELKRLGILLVRQAGPQAATYELQEVGCAQLVRSQNDQALIAQRSGFERPGLYTQFNSSKKNSGPQPALPPRTIRNEYGRESPNPEWLRINAVLRDARDRITRAKDPIAYERALLRAELRKPPARETGGLAPAASVAASQ